MLRKIKRKDKRKDKGRALSWKHKFDKQQEDIDIFIFESYNIGNAWIASPADKILKDILKSKKERIRNKNLRTNLDTNPMNWTLVRDSANNTI